MQKKYPFILFVLLNTTAIFFSACQSERKKETSLSALETAQQFIRLEMKGEFENADEYLLASDYNRNKLSADKKRYDLISEEVKKQLKSEIIKIESYEETSDSTAILNYSNAVDTILQCLYLERQNEKWFVNFKVQNPSK